MRRAAASYSKDGRLYSWLSNRDGVGHRARTKPWIYWTTCLCGFTVAKVRRGLAVTVVAAMPHEGFLMGAGCKRVSSKSTLALPIFLQITMRMSLRKSCWRRCWKTSTVSARMAARGRYGTAATVFSPPPHPAAFFCLATCAVGSNSMYAAVCAPRS